MAKPAPSAMRRLVFEHITGADTGAVGSLVSGIPGAKLQDVVFRDIQLSMAGGGTSQDATREGPERSNAYPDAFSFGPKVPAYGSWIRHAERITFDRVTLTLNKLDARPGFVVGHDAEGGTQNAKSP